VWRQRPPTASPPPRRTPPHAPTSPAPPRRRRRAGCWYAIQALAEAGALGAILVASRRYSTNSDAILAAVQQVQDGGKGAGVGPKGRPERPQPPAARAAADAAAAAAAGLARDPRARAPRPHTRPPPPHGAFPQLAGPASGIGIVDSTKFAVNTLKVIQVLEGISEDLKVGAGVGGWVGVG
jgi:hypothetical protein